MHVYIFSQGDHQTPPNQIYVSFCVYLDTESPVRSVLSAHHPSAIVDTNETASTPDKAVLEDAALWMCEKRSLRKIFRMRPLNYYTMALTMLHSNCSCSLFVIALFNKTI